jgi:RNA polymerase sigma factor (sigma-70 family)
MAALATAMPTEPEPVAELTTLHVRRARQGDSESLAWVVHRLAPLLLAQATWRLGPRLRRLYEPADLVNDAWLVTLDRLRDLPERDGRYTPVLLRFLSTTLLHRINNLVRKHIRGGVEEERAVAAPATAPIEEIPAATRGAVTRAMQDEVRGIVRSCLDELEDRDREILILRGVEQHPNQTVALLLGLTPQGATMRYQRALARLRERLPGSVFEELDEG